MQIIEFNPEEVKRIYLKIAKNVKGDSLQELSAALALFLVEICQKTTEPYSCLDAIKDNLDRTLKSAMEYDAEKKTRVKNEKN